MQNLRANAASLGEVEPQKTFVLEEIKAQEDHFLRAIRGSDSYYKKKFGTIQDKIRPLISFAGLKVGGFVWGHGERSGRIFISAFIFIFALSFLNFWAVLPRMTWAQAGYGLNIFKYCMDLFIDYNPDPKFKGFVFVDYTLMFMRYVYIGLFVSVLFKGISHR